MKKLIISKKLSKFNTYILKIVYININKNT